METLDLGGARLHVVVSCPGLPGAADEAKRAIATLDPAIVVVDADTQDALRLRKDDARFEPSFIDALFAAECNRRFAKGDPPGEHPLVAASRMAAKHRAAFVPLRPAAKRPGFFARRRAARAAADARADAADRYPLAFANALRQARAWRAEDDARLAAPRLQAALRDGRAPIVAILQAHRAPFLLAEARRLA